MGVLRRTERWSVPLLSFQCEPATMSEFQVLAIPICFVLGVGIVKILDGAGAAIRRREQAELYWLPFIWAFIILVFQLQFFTMLWNLHLDDKSWTWGSYGLILIHPFMYLLATSLLWPGHSVNHTDSMRVDFEKNGRWAVAVIASTLYLAIVLNVYAYGSTWTEVINANILNIILAALSTAVVVFSDRHRWQVAATLAFLAIQMYGMLFVWSRPGYQF